MQFNMSNPFPNTVFVEEPHIAVGDMHVRSLFPKLPDINSFWDSHWFVVNYVRNSFEDFFGNAIKVLLYPDAGAFAIYSRYMMEMIWSSQLFFRLGDCSLYSPYGINYWELYKRIVRGFECCDYATFRSCIDYAITLPFKSNQVTHSEEMKSVHSQYLFRFFREFPLHKSWSPFDEPLKIFTEEMLNIESAMMEVK